MDPMYVLTVKKDGGTQEVVGFFTVFELGQALAVGKNFLAGALHSRRAIMRLEYYNPLAAAAACQPVSLAGYPRS